MSIVTVFPLLTSICWKRTHTCSYIRYISWDSNVPRHVRLQWVRGEFIAISEFVLSLHFTGCAAHASKEHCCTYVTPNGSWTNGLCIGLTDLSFWFWLGIVLVVVCGGVLSCLRNLGLFAVLRPIKSLKVLFRALIPHALTVPAKDSA